MIDNPARTEREANTWPGNLRGRDINSQHLKVFSLILSKHIDGLLAAQRALIYPPDNPHVSQLHFYCLWENDNACFASVRGFSELRFRSEI